MSDPRMLQPDPGMIGGISKAPFVFLPDPTRLFARRAERFDELAPTSTLGPYLAFLGQLTQAQSALAEALPAPAPLPLDQVALASANAMPPLDRQAMAADPALRTTLDALFDLAQPIAKPAAAAEALRMVMEAEPAALDLMIANVLSDVIPIEALATHLYVAAGAQVYAAKRAATLDSARLVPVEIGLCPCCGGRPVASVVVGFPGADGARYAACSLCGTLWNEVRVKCLACGSTKGIGYRAVESDSDTVTLKAEVCDTCHSWFKILYQNDNPSLEAVADDIASLGLDVLMRETEYQRKGFDPFLLGY